MSLARKFDLVRSSRRSLISGQYFIVDAQFGILATVYSIQRNAMQRDRPKGSFIWYERVGDREKELKLASELLWSGFVYDTCIRVNKILDDR